MSGTQYISASDQVDTPNGFMVAAPWSTVDKTLYVDIKAYLASVRLNRNVLSARVAVKSKTNVATDQTFLLPQTSNDQANSSYVYTAVPDNATTVVSSNRPVHLVLTTPNGVLDLGQQTLFIFSGPIISVGFTNSQNVGPAEVNLIVV